RPGLYQTCIRCRRVGCKREVGGDHMSTNIDKNPRDVILSPVVSEKSYADMEEGRHTILVDPRRTASQLHLAIATIFDVKLASVNTMRRQGKRQRTRFGYGSRNDVKRAVVTLKEGSIDIFGGPALEDRRPLNRGINLWQFVNTGRLPRASAARR